MIATKDRLRIKYDRLSTEALTELLPLWTKKHKEAPRLDAKMSKHEAFYHCAAIRSILIQRGIRHAHR